MPSLPALRTCLATAFILTEGVFAAPQVAFAINSQFPPAAYVSQPFDFTFLPNTFAGNTSELTYSLSEQPTWLSLDSPNRRLYGTPTLDSVGASSFSLVASDTSGQSYSSVTLVVVENRTLHSRIGTILPLLANAGSVSSPATLLLYPEQKFTFPLSSDLFGGVSASTVFYTTSSGGSPLPSWLQFDSNSIQYSGITPPLVPPSPSEQAFSFDLIASDVVGFSEAKIQFEILISYHLIAFNRPLFSFSASRNAVLSIPSLLRNLTYDNLAARRDQIASVETNSPPWLAFNSSDLSFTGTVPQAAQNSTFSIILRGVGANVLNQTILANVHEGQNIPQRDIGNVSLTGGAYFSYTISIPSGFDSNTTIAIDAGELPSWLLFTASNHTIQGEVPNNATAGVRSISFTFSSGNESLIENLNLVINQSPTPSASATSTGTSTTSSSSSTASSDESVSSKRRRLVTLILAIMIPVMIVILLTCFILTSRWVRRHRMGDQAETQTEKPDLGQLPSSVEQQGQSNSNNESSMPGSVLRYENAPDTVNGAPHIELSWPPASSKNTRRRFSKRVRVSQNSAIGSSWDDLIEHRLKSKEDLPPRPISTSQDGAGWDIIAPLRPVKAGAVPKRPARPPSPDIRHAFQSPRFSRTVESSSKLATGFPKRLSGAGHGTGIGERPANADSRSSWQTTMGTMPMTESRPSTRVMTSFPAPASLGSLSAISSTKESSSEHSTDHRPTMRFVHRSSQGSQSSDAAKRIHDQVKRRERSKTAAKSSHATSRKTTKVMASRTMSGSVRQKTASEKAGAGQEDGEMYSAPPVPKRSQARLGADHVSVLGPRAPHGRRTSNLSREMSTVSSHQFDSAMSSDSQWEDESLERRNDAFRKRHWDRRAEPSTNMPPARRSSKFVVQAAHPIPESEAAPDPLRAYIADQRRNITVEYPGLAGSKRSHQGSFRFI